LPELPAFLAGHELSSWAALAGLVIGTAALPAAVVPYRDAFVLSGVILILLFRPQGIIPAATVRRG
jgi:branched-subunit amino acid ABC-type transport system permease component